MKLIKIMPSKIQIRTDDDEFRKSRLNDLISISDGEVELVTMVSSITDNEVAAPIDENEFLGEFEYPSVKMLECSILGSVIRGKFSGSLDRYPATDIQAKPMTDEEFSGMLSYNAEESFILGKYANYDCNALVNGNKFYQRHSCIVGNTGSGKSETVAKIMEETAKNTDCNIIVFDIHGEYSKLSYVDPVKIGKDFSFPVWMLGFSDMAANILKIREETSTTVISALRKAYYSFCPEGNENKPVYFDFKNFLDFMKALDVEVIGTGEFYKTGDKAGMAKTAKGDYNGKLSGIINTMEALHADRRYSFLFGNETQDYLVRFIERVMGGNKPVKNIDLSEVPHDVAVLIIGAVTKLVYNIQIMQKENISPITLICDEAHVYIPADFQLSASQRRMVEIFEDIAKEGRKFGITLFVASQRPSELNRTIMAQCANYIVMKLNNENDKTMVKGIMAEGSSGIIETTTMFSPGDALVIGDSVPIPMKIHVGLADERPQSRTIDFWTEWKQGNGRPPYANYAEEYLGD